MAQPIVSIIIPCYNDVAYIQQCVTSAIEQSVAKEIIVVDDGSNRETKDVLKTLEPSIDRLITQDNLGQGAARNRGIENASGTFILVLDSDDWLESDFCEKAISRIHGQDGVRLVSCAATVHFENGKEEVFEPKGGSSRAFLYSNRALGNCALFRKEDWKLCGGYDETMRQGWEDWEFYIRLMALGGQCRIIQEPLFHYRKRGQSTTSRANKNKYELWRYIFNKHKVLYTENYEATIDFLLDKIEREENEKIKNTKRIEFKIGAALLNPFRKLSQLWR